MLMKLNIKKNHNACFASSDIGKGLELHCRSKFGHQTIQCLSKRSIYEDSIYFGKIERATLQGNYATYSIYCILALFHLWVFTHPMLPYLVIIAWPALHIKWQFSRDNDLFLKLTVLPTT